MIKLHLGVVDIPYSTAPGRGRRRAVTTGDVAGWLEDKYHPMESFFESNREEISKDLEEGLAKTLESLLVGAPRTMDPFGSGTSKIEDRFKKFLSLREFEALGIPGVPTKAALDGVNHRKKRPVTGVRRPSLIDTGLYQASFKSWVD